MKTNRQWRLRSRPVGMVKESDFELVEELVPEPGDGEILVRNEFISLDPAMRGWLNDVKSYVPPVGIGEVMRASSVGEVVTSRNPEFPVGTKVSCMLGWQEFGIPPLGNPMAPIQRVPEGIPPQWLLGVLGPPGLTAYVGMLETGKLRQGDAVLVSGAAGATGSVAAQVARLEGASRVVGLAGGPAKCKWLVEEAKLDAAIDYKSEDLSKRLRQEFPKGIDLFFDNVGGDVLDTVLTRMALRGRIVLCGGISSYNAAEPPPGPRNLLVAIAMRLKIEGFIFFDHQERIAEGGRRLAQWLEAGEIAHVEDVQKGIENAPKTLLRLYEGKNLGKQLLQVA